MVNDVPRHTVITVLCVRLTNVVVVEMATFLISKDYENQL